LTVRSVALGIGTALAVALPAVLIVQVVDALSDSDDVPALAYPFAVLVFAGMAVGGWVVAPRAPRAPRWTGALVGAGAIAVVLAVGIARQIVAGDDVAWGSLPVLTVLAAGFGATGAALAARRPGRTRP
jgi:predicted permease